jgi:hypothetical protein
VAWITNPVTPPSSHRHPVSSIALRAFKELIALGFIEETRHGSLNRKTRVASEWRLTA